MVDYAKFEDDIVIQMEDVLKKWLEENDDIYILSLDCARGMDSIRMIGNTRDYLTEQTNSDSEDYWYYKYCEEEWDLYDTFEEISFCMNKVIQENEERFTNPITFEYTEEFDEHCDKMIETCKKVLCRLKQSIDKASLNLMLTFNIREYLDDEERIEIFTKVNSKEAAKEYIEHIKEFN